MRKGGRFPESSAGGQSYKRVTPAACRRSTMTHTAALMASGPVGTRCGVMWVCMGLQYLGIAMPHAALGLLLVVELGCCVPAQWMVQCNAAIQPLRNRRRRAAQRRAVCSIGGQTCTPRAGHHRSTHRKPASHQLHRCCGGACLPTSSQPTMPLRLYCSQLLHMRTML